MQRNKRKYLSMTMYRKTLYSVMLMSCADKRQTPNFKQRHQHECAWRKQLCLNIKDHAESDTFYLSRTMLGITFPLEQKTKASGALGSWKN